MTGRLRSVRWRPPDARHGLRFYRGFAVFRLIVTGLLVVLGIVSLVSGGEPGLLVLSLILAALTGPVEVWRLLGIRAIERERRSDAATSDTSNEPGRDAQPGRW